MKYNFLKDFLILAELLTIQNIKHLFTISLNWMNIPKSLRRNTRRNIMLQMWTSKRRRCSCFSLHNCKVNMLGLVLLMMVQFLAKSSEGKILTADYKCCYMYGYCKFVTANFELTRYSEWVMPSIILDKLILRRLTLSYSNT